MRCLDYSKRGMELTGLSNPRRYGRGPAWGMACISLLGVAASPVGVEAADAGSSGLAVEMAPASVSVALRSSDGALQARSVLQRADCWDAAPPGARVNCHAEYDEGDTQTFGLAHYSGGVVTPTSVRLVAEYSTFDITATAGADYTASHGRLTIEVGEMYSRVVNFLAHEDLLDEHVERFGIKVDPIRGTTPLNLDYTVMSIRDTDDPPNVSIADAAGLESSGSLAFAVELDAPSGKRITVDLATSDGTATAGADYQTTTGTLTFDAGTTTATAHVQVENDGIAESDETFQVTLSMPVDVTVASAADGSATGTIEDTGTIPRFAVADAQGVEDVAGSLGFVVTLEQAGAADAAVDYATRDGTATAGTDYEQTMGTLTIPAGEMTGTIDIDVEVDSVPEDEETFSLVLTGSGDAVVLGSGFGTGTILDDDTVLSTEDVGVAEGDGTMEFVVKAAYGGGRTADATVDYETVDATATAGSDYERKEGTLTFAPGVASQTIVVSVTDDDLDEPEEETLNVAFSNERNAVLREASAVGTIRDNDDPPTVELAPATGVEGDGELVFVASLTGPSGLRVGQNYATEELSGEDAARQGEDFEYKAGRLVFEPGETEIEIPVKVYDDALDEPDEKLELRTYPDDDLFGLGLVIGEGTIEDDDDPPQLTVSDEEAPEDAGGMSFEVTLSASSGRDVVVDYGTADRTALKGSDYDEEKGSLTFRAGERVKTVPVTVLDDALSEADETFVLELGAADWATVGDGEGTGTIVDDDDATTELSVRGATGTEGETVDFAVSLSDPSGRTVTTGYRTVDGTAVEGADYAATSGTLTFAPGETGATIPVALTDDALNERTETFRLVLESPSNATLAKGRARGTVEDDDPPPAVSVGDDDGPEDVGELEFAVTLGSASGREVTVSYGTADGSAVADADYAEVREALTFAAGETAKTVQVEVVDDDLHESDETFELVLSDPDGAVPGTARGTGSIRDNDDPPPTIGLDAASGVEGGTADFVVSLDKPSGQTVTVAYATSDGTAAAGEDYEAADGVLTLAPTRMSGTIAVELVDDAVDEPNETFALSLSAPRHATVGTMDAAGTVEDNDDPPVLSVADVAGTEGGAVELTVTLTGSSSAEVAVTYATSDGTATAGADYGTAAGELTFAPGGTGRTVSVALVDDAVNEPKETFAFTLSRPENATLGTAAAQVTVIDDDGAPQLSVTGGSAVEGGSVAFAVTVAGARSQAATVAYATSDLTATAGEDYEAAQGTLTFAAGDSGDTVTVTLLDDAVYEPAERFALTLSSAVNATIAAGTAEGGIVDDDGRPTLAIAGAAGVEGGGEMEFEVTLSGTGSEPVTVVYGTADGTALAGADYEAAQGTLTFAAGESARTLRVTLLDDAEHEPEETFDATLSSATNAVVETGRAQGRISDDDAPPTLAVAPATGAEGGVVQFVVALAGATGRTVTVAYATADGTARSPADYQRARGRLTYAPGETRRTVAVQLAEDVLDEPDETFALTLSSAVNAVVAGAEADGTILDDDQPPGLSVTGGADIEGGEVVFGVALAAPSGRTVVADYATSDGTASAGEDYEAKSGRLTFPPGAVAREIRVALLDDAFDEPEETFALTLSSPENASLTSGSADGRIVDNDGPPQLTVSDEEAPEDAGGMSFEVTLSASSGRDVVVDYGTADRTALKGSDYDEEKGSLTFRAGERVKTVPVAVRDDALSEADETFVLELGAADWATVGDGEGTGTIMDDDDATTELSVRGATATEGETADFAVSLSDPSGRTVTTRYRAVDGTAVEGADYAATSGTLTFAPGETGATIPVVLTEDALNERTETFRLVLESPSNATLAKGWARGTVEDDDPPPAVSVGDDDGPEDVGELEFAVTLGSASGREVTVSYGTADGSAVADADYAEVRDALTFAAGETAKTVRVAVVDDDLHESDETFELVLSDPDGAVPGTARGTGSIRDNDEPPPTIGLDAASGVEGGTADFVVSLDKPSGQTVTVAYATSDGTAAAGEDYEAADGVLTLAPTRMSGTIAVELVDDAVDEPNETFALSLSAPRHATVGTMDAAGTVEDNDDPPVLSVADVAGTEGGAVELTVTLTGSSSAEVAVTYATSDGTATAGADYGTAAGVLTFAPGGTGRTVSVALVDDAVNEPKETFAFTLSRPENATLGTAAAQVTVIDDDGAPQLSVTGGSAVEGGSVAFAVTVAGARSQAATVAYATSDLTATAGEDYEAAQGTLTFAAGDSGGTVTVALLDDAVYEPAERFALTLSSAVNATIAAGTAEGGIVDDDGRPTLAIAGAAGVEGGGAMEFEVTLSGTGSEPVTVVYGTADGTALAGADYEAAQGTLTFAAGESARTLRVTLLDDAEHEPEETFDATLSSATNAVVETGRAQGRIADDDAPPTLAVAPATGAEGGVVQFVVALAGATGRTVTVAYATADGTARSPADYQRARGRLTYAPGETRRTVAVQLAEDVLDEPDETFALTLSSAVNAVVAGAEADGTILDDDQPPGLSVTGGADIEGGEVVFGVALAAPSGRTVVADYATSDGTASAGEDYEAASGRLTFPPGAVAREIRVTLLDDAFDEPEETFALTLSSPENASLTSGSADGRIVDNDGPPQLTVSDEEAPEDAGGMSFEVTLSASSGRDVVVDYGTADRTALKGSDYDEEKGSLTFRAGERVKTVPVAVRDDALSEADETFVLELGAADWATVGDGEGTGTIVDDDDATTELSVRGATATEGETADFAVSLSDPSGRTVTTGYRAVDGTAVEGADYAATSGTLTFAPGETGATIPVVLTEDALNERTETFQLVLESPSNATLAKGRATGTVEDDDPPPAVSVGDDDGPEDVGELEFAVTLGSASGREVTVSYGTADGSAVADADYAEARDALTFAVGETAKTVRVAVLDDDLHESDETFELVLSDPDGAVPGTARGTGSIRDNDEPPPTIGLDAASGVEGGTADFVVSLDKPSGQTVTVAYATSDGTAAAGEDYEAADGVLTLAPTRMSGTIAVELVDDAVDEPNETFALSLSAPRHATVGTMDAAGTVEDNDDPPVLSVADVAGTEGGAVELTVTLTGSSSAEVAVAYATSDGTATAGADYGTAAGELTFAPGGTGRTVSVALVDDAVNEPKETFAFTLSRPENATLGTAAAQVTVIDDDGAPQLSVTGGSAVEGGSVAFAVTVAGARSQAATVAYATSDLTATAGEDYEAAQGTLTFAAGDSGDTVTVLLLDDAVYEPAEKFALTLSSAVNATIAAGTAEGGIVDDDGRPTLAIAGAAGVEGGGEMEFEVTLSGTGSEPVTVVYGTADGTALAGADYEAAQGTLTFAAGESARTLRVTLLDDAEHEPEETFDATLSSATNAVVETGRAQGRISDDDAPPTLAVAPATGAEGGVVQFVVALAGATGRTVTVAYATADGTARSPADYQRARGRLTYAPGETRKTVPVSLAEDVLDEPDETFALTLSSAVNAVVAGAEADGTILDDDQPPGLSVTGGADIEGGEVVFGVALAAPSGRTVVAGYATSDGTASAGEDYVAKSGRLTFPPGAVAREIRVALLDDAFDEPEETFALTLSSPENASLTSGSADGRIVDNDGAATLTIGDAEADEGAALDFVVRLSGSSDRTATVRWATMDGTAASAEDYEAAEGVLTFAAGVETAVVSIRSVEDDVVEADEMFEVVLSSAENASVADARGTGSIVDDDRHREISVADATATEGEVLDFVVTLDEPTPVPATVDYATSDGTARAGDDYAPAQGTLTFPAGGTRGTVSVALTEDDAPEPEESFALTLSAPTNAVLADDTATGTIIDDDRHREISVADATAAEGEVLDFVVTLDEPTSLPATVDYATSDGTARAGDDYAPAQGTLTFPAGGTRGTVSVALTEDDAPEPEESFGLTLSAPTNAVLADDTATGTIIDDDRHREISVADATAAEGEVLDFVVTLDEPTSLSATVDYATSDGTAGAGEDYAPAQGTLTFPAGGTRGTVSVALTEDDVPEPEESFGLTLSAPTNAVLADDTATGTIIDDDRLSVLAIADASATEGAGELSFAVTLDAATTLGGDGGLRDRRRDGDAGGGLRGRRRHPDVRAGRACAGDPRAGLRRHRGRGRRDVRAGADGPGRRDAGRRRGDGHDRGRRRAAGAVDRRRVRRGRRWRTRPRGCPGPRPDGRRDGGLHDRGRDRRSGGGLRTTVGHVDLRAWGDGEDRARGVAGRRRARGRRDVRGPSGRAPGRDDRRRRGDGRDHRRRRPAGAVHRGRVGRGGCRGTGVRRGPGRRERGGSDGGVRDLGRHRDGGRGLRVGGGHADVRARRDGEGGPGGGGGRRGGGAGRGDLRRDARRSGGRDLGGRRSDGHDPRRRPRSPDGGRAIADGDAVRGGRRLRARSRRLLRRHGTALLGGVVRAWDRDGCARREQADGGAGVHRRVRSGGVGDQPGGIGERRAGGARGRRPGRTRGYRRGARLPRPGRPRQRRRRRRRPVRRGGASRSPGSKRLRVAGSVAAGRRERRQLEPVRVRSGRPGGIRRGSRVGGTAGHGTRSAAAAVRNPQAAGRVLAPGVGRRPGPRVDGLGPGRHAAFRVGTGWNVAPRHPDRHARGRRRGRRRLACRGVGAAHRGRRGLPVPAVGGRLRRRDGRGAASRGPHQHPSLRGPCPRPGLGVVGPRRRRGRGRGRALRVGADCGGRSLDAACGARRAAPDRARRTARGVGGGGAGGAPPVHRERGAACRRPFRDGGAGEAGIGVGRRGAGRLRVFPCHLRARARPPRLGRRGDGHRIGAGRGSALPEPAAASGRRRGDQRACAALGGRRPGPCRQPGAVVPAEGGRHGLARHAVPAAGPRATRAGPCRQRPVDRPLRDRVARRT